MKRVFFAVLSIAGVGCLSTVDQRWCGPLQPCTAGYVCTPDFHCVLPRGVDGGTGGGRVDGGTGGGAGGGGGGGAVGGGGGALGGGGGGRAGGGAGGGGGAQCNFSSCSTGCCLGGNCVPVMQQANSVCGFFGNACSPCGMNEGCVNGQCQRVIFTDAGTIGGACMLDSNCGSDNLSFCIPEISGGQPTGFAGGYCSRFCDNEPCPPEARCIEAETEGGGTVNICLAGCMAQAACRPGYQCQPDGVCLP